MKIKFKDNTIIIEETNEEIEKLEYLQNYYPNITLK